MSKEMSCVGRFGWRLKYVNYFEDKNVQKHIREKYELRDRWEVVYMLITW